MPTAAINGVKLNYLCTGDGADVVLVHGLASSMAFWYSGTILPLRHYYRVTAYDLRGHGYSSMPPSGYTYLNMADDLAGLADSLGLEKFHLVGHSYGGLASISYALRYPQRLRSLVLADVPLNEINPTPQWPLWWPSLTKLQDLGIVVSHDDPYPELRMLEELACPQIRQQVGKLLPVNQRLPYGNGREKGAERTAKRWLKLLQTTTARDDIRFRRLSAADLRGIAVETLAIYGTESKWRSSGEILRNYLSQVEVVYVDRAGHAHPWERPTVFFRHLRRFLAASDRLEPYFSREGRKYKRFPLEIPVQLKGPNGVRYAAKTVNASLNGLLLECPQIFGQGFEIEIIANGNQKGMILTIPGKIVREEKEDGLAVARLGVELLLPGKDDKAWEDFLAKHQTLITQ